MYRVSILFCVTLPLISFIN